MPELPRLLWLYQMAIIFFWISDDSKGQARTLRLLDTSLSILLALLKLSSRKLPGISRINQQIVGLLAALESE